MMLTSLLVNAQIAITVQGIPGLYDSRMNTFGQCETQGVKFFFEPMDENISPDDLEFQEYADYVAAYFVMWGAKRVTSITEADMFVLIDYGIGETKPLVYHKPIVGKTGISSQRTTFYKNTAYTTYTNSYGVVGYDTREVEQYRKHIDLYVYEITDNENPKPVWQANIENISQGKNLAASIPIMLWNFRKYIGDRGVTGDREFPVRVNGKEWADDMKYNYYSKYISEGKGNSWHGITTDWNFWQKTEKTSLYPEVLYNGDSFTDVIFYCPCYASKDMYQYKIPSDTYIEYNGKRYKAIKSFGCEFDKKNQDIMQRTFVIRFERVPNEAINGRISIYSDVKGKHKYGWENIGMF